MKFADARRRSGPVVLFLLLLGGSLPAHAQHIVYVAHGGGNVAAPFGGEIGTIDLDTGDYTSLTPSLGSLTSLASDGTNLYTYETQSASILTVNPATGDVLDSVELTGVEHLTDMTYHAPSGTFYGVGTDDNLYTVNVSTGVASFVSALDTGGGGFRQLASAPNGTLYYHATNTPGEFFIINPANGAVLTTISGGVPGGALGIEVDPASGLLIASECCDSPDGSLGERVFSVDPSDGSAVLLYDYDDERRIQDLAFLEIGIAPAPRAVFRVSKDFADDNPAGVEVTISCNTGLPLEQSKVITEDEGVGFVVIEFDSGELDCEVTENVPAGYDAVYFDGTSNSSTSCEYLNVGAGGVFACSITNTPAPVDVVIHKDWVIEGSIEDSDGVSQEFRVTLTCDSEIAGGYPVNGDWRAHADREGEATITFEVIPEFPSTTCEVEETVFDSAVEVDNACGQFEVSAADGHECTITNTVFFEGIPTLNQYGLAILALLMLGLGFVGFRRFA